MDEVAVSVVLCPLQIVAELELMETVGVGFTVATTAVLPDVQPLFVAST